MNHKLAKGKGTTYRNQGMYNHLTVDDFRATAQTPKKDTSFVPTYKTRRPGPPPHILIADDDEATRNHLAALLESHGMQVFKATDGQHAVSLVRERRMDLVLLDVVMPGLSGLDSCRLIKGITTDGFLPVVLLTACSDTDSRVSGLRIGADDYVSKPFDERELLARVQNLLRVKRMHDEIDEARIRFEQLAVRDELTGLYNYRYLHSRLADEFKRAERYRDPLSCIMLDIDYFKAINDQYGHDGGDDILQQVAQRLNSAVREIDVVTRYGGEEFLLVLPSTSFAGAVAVAGRVWKAIRSTPFNANGASARITVSVGVAVYPSRDIKNKDELVKAADLALYQSKHEGRDRICLFHHQGYIYTPQIDADAADDAEKSASGT